MQPARLSTTTPCVCVNTEPVNTSTHGVFLRPSARLRSRAVTAMQCNQQRLVGQVSLSGVFTVFKAPERHPEASRSTVMTLARTIAAVNLASLHLVLSLVFIMLVRRWTGIVSYSITVGCVSFT
jgi:hypothetical protein